MCTILGIWKKKFINLKFETEIKKKSPYSVIPLQSVSVIAKLFQYDLHVRGIDVYSRCIYLRFLVKQVNMQFTYTSRLAAGMRELENFMNEIVVDIIEVENKKLFGNSPRSHLKTFKENITA